MADPLVCFQFRQNTQIEPILHTPPKQNMWSAPFECCSFPCTFPTQTIYICFNKHFLSFFCCIRNEEWEGDRETVEISIDLPKWICFFLRKNMFHLYLPYCKTILFRFCKIGLVTSTNKSFIRWFVLISSKLYKFK